MALTEEGSPEITRCSVFISFKSLLFLIYHVIHVFIQKLAGVSILNSFPKPKSYAKAKSSEQSQNNNCKHARVKEIWEIPGPRPLPFFGTLLTSSALRSSDLMRVNEERQKKYGSTVKEEHFWNYPLVMILGSEEIKKIVRANPITRPGMEILTQYRSLRPDRYNSLGLVNSQGNMWKKLHSTFSCVITNMKFVRTLLPVFDEITSDVITVLSEDQNPVSKLPQLLNKLISEASFYSAFGQRMGFIGKKRGLSEKLEVFSNCHDAYWQAFHKSMYGFPWWKYFPTKIWKDFTAAEDRMMDMIKEITETLLKTDSAGGVLAAVQNQEISMKDLTVVLLEIITGATEPVFHAVIITLYWISKHENVYNKVLEELKEQLPNKDSPVDDAVLDNVPYLKACVMETFRICPTTCNLARVLDKELQIGEYRLPPYTSVILQTWHACLQDSSFYRAKEYLPERWLLKDGVPPFRPHERQVMCNFGIGMRACPGRKIATQLINTFLCKILRNFKVKFSKDIDLRYEWLLVVKDPIIIELEEHDK